MSIRKLSVCVILLAMLTALSSCLSLQKNPVSGNKRLYGYSWEEEIKLGRQADSEIVAEYGLLNNDEISAYVTDLGEELLKVSHLRREGTDKQFRETEFTFRVLDSPVVNAFALPGGFVYVTRGLMAHLENEAQLAVVLGHEIGHVAARHASQRAAEQQFGQLAVIGGAVVGQQFGLDGGNILQLSSQTAQLLFLSYSRDDERESDRLGVEYSAMTNYEAAEGAKFFTSLKRISENAGVNIPSHLSSHPDPGEREQTIPKLASEWEEKGYDQYKVDGEEYLNMINGMIFGDNPRNGFTRDNTFYHPDLKFKFSVPVIFNVINQSNAIILVNESQDAIVQIAIDSKNSDPRASVGEVLSQDGIEIVSATEPVEGMNAYSATVDVANEQGGSIRARISALRFNENTYRFISYSSVDTFSEYASRFEAVLRSFTELTDPDILNTQPVRLQLKNSNGQSLGQQLPADLPMDIEAEKIAIINQVQLDEIVPAGKKIKIPVQ